MKKRITHEPAYVLHSYDWSESSLILETFTRHHGRVALVAKGAKRPSSNFRPILLPLQFLHLGYVGAEEIGVLKSAEWQGGHVMPTGKALLSGYYLNELLLRMLPRDDAHPALFDAYAATVAWLTQQDQQEQGSGAALSAGLSAFELVLLKEAGFLPALDVQTLNYQALQEDGLYVLQPEGGLLAVTDTFHHTHAYTQDGMQGMKQGKRQGKQQGVLGKYWLALHTAIETAMPLQALLLLFSQNKALTMALRPQLRQLLEHHCGHSRLRTRQLMMELRGLSSVKGTS